jgi:hypothetical protein
VTDFAALSDFGWIVWLQVACDRLQPLNLTSAIGICTIGSQEGGVTSDRHQKADRFGLIVRFALSVASIFRHSKTQSLRG